MTPDEQAIQAALDSLSRAISTDLELAQTHAARDWMSDEPHVTGWQRVADAGACHLCEAAASGQVYHSEDLAPIHHDCGCGVEPVTGPVDKYTPIDEHVKVTEDGEIGPLLDALTAKGEQLLAAQTLEAPATPATASQ